MNKVIHTNSNKSISEDIEEFEFNTENLQRAKEIMLKYPEDRKSSAVMPLLYLAQSQCGNYIPLAAINYVADFLNMRRIHVYEVATFYTMYNLSPVGKYLIQICRTTPCWLCGSDDILEACKQELNIEIGETTADKLFTLKEVECLGACINAPVVQINDDYYENVTKEKMIEIITSLKKQG